MESRTAMLAFAEKLSNSPRQRSQKESVIRTVLVTPNRNVEVRGKILCIQELSEWFLRLKIERQ